MESCIDKPRNEVKKKKDLNVELAEFLAEWDSQHLTSFLREAIQLFELFDIEDDHDWVIDQVGQENAQNVRIIRTAYLISRIAEFHAGKLCTIKVRFKNLWERLEKECIQSTNT